MLNPIEYGDHCARLESDDERRESMARFDTPTMGEICDEQLSRIDKLYQTLLDCKAYINSPSERRKQAVLDEIDAAFRRIGRR